MKVAKVYGRNFLSFVEFSFEFPEGLVAIIGENRDCPGARSNGAGKTTLVDAVAFALYGETTRGVGGDDVVHVGAGKNCMTAVEFDDGTVIARFRKDKTGKNTVTITKGDQPVHQDRVKDVQHQINAYVGADWGTFRQAVLFGQDASRFLALTDSEKKAILERLLGMDILDRAASLSRDEGRKSAQRVIELDREVAVSKAEVDGLRREYDARRRALDHWRAEQESYKARIREEMHQERARKLEVDFQLAKRTSELSRAKERLLAQKGELGSQLTELEGVFKEAEASLKMVSDSHMKAKEDVAKQNERYMLLVNKLESFNGLAAECPTCYQKVDNDHKSSIAKDLHQEIMGARAKLEQIKAVRDGLMKEHSEVESIKNEIAVTVNGTKDDKVKVDREIAQTETKLAATNDEADREDSVHLSRIKELERKLAEDGAAPDTGANLEAINAAITDKEAKIGLAASARAEAAAQCEIYEFWAEGFGLHGLRSMILDNVLPFLEERANGYLTELTGGTTRLALSPVSAVKGGKEMRDSISVALTTSHGPNSYEGLSGGERQRVDVAMSLALFDLARANAGIDIGLAVFDEVFERLDEAGCEIVGALLRKNAPRWGSVLLITHLDSLLVEIPNRVRVLKERGESRIDEKIGMIFTRHDHALPERIIV